MHRVVILGGGFGGLYAAKTLRHASVELTVIDKRNFHLFQPLLYQVATGSLSPGEIAAPLRSVLSRQKNTRVVLDEGVSLDVEQRCVITKGESSPAGSIAYDTLIVATGARNTYFGHNDWQAVAPGLKSIEDATTMRSRILYAFEAAERELDPERRRAWLTFIVVGAGPTGVELAGALAEIARDTLRHDFRSIHPEESQIVVMDGSPRILPAYPQDLSAQAERSLIRLGVHLRKDANVIAIDAEGVTFQTQQGVQRLASNTVLWAAGVAPSEFGKVLEQRAGATLNRNGQVQVAPDLTIPGHPEIFVVGDLAFLEQDGKPLPGVAPVAMQQGRYAAEVILRRLREAPSSRAPASEPFRYFNKGSLAVIGRGAGIADFGSLRFHGFAAWLLWLFVHLMYLIQFQNRLIVFIRWGLQYLTFSRGARLITGDQKE